MEPTSTSRESDTAPDGQGPQDAQPGDGRVHPLPAGEPAPARRRWEPSNLTLRLLTAAVLIPPLLWVVHAGGLAFVGVAIVISCVGINEFYNFISQKGATPHRLLGTIAAAVLPLIVYFGDAFFATSFLTAVLLTTMVLQLTKQQIREAIASVSATFFGVFYVAWLFSHAISIRFIDVHLGQTAATVQPCNTVLVQVVIGCEAIIVIAAVIDHQGLVAERPTLMGVASGL